MNISENEHICGTCSFSEMFLSFGTSLDGWRGCSVIVDVYRPQRSWGKAIFSQASVILFTGGGGGVRGCLSACWDTTPLWQGRPPSKETPPGKADPPHPARHEHFPGQTPSLPLPPDGHCNGSLHPTGMHSCYRPLRSNKSRLMNLMCGKDLKHDM